jgi:hypothetical protein
MFDKMELIVLRLILKRYISDHGWMFELNKLTDKLDSLIGV